ncbi:MAG: hypothetical protein HQ495_07055 [Alphaproteobacteria bacterium]|nr:hypothetical protein [Alphaproteobacteria bacterium]
MGKRLNDHWQRKLKPDENRRRAYGLPRRNWIVVVIIIAALAIWQYRGGGTSFDVAPDLRNYSREEFDAAKILMTAGFAIVTTPAACQQQFDAFNNDESWKSAVESWNDRHQTLMAKVLQISEETGLSGTRGRDALRNDSLRLVNARISQWQGREAEQCARFVDQMNNGIWDLTVLPELPNLIAAVEAAPAKTTAE